MNFIINKILIELPHSSIQADDDLSVDKTKKPRLDKENENENEDPNKEKILMVKVSFFNLNFFYNKKLIYSMIYVKP